MLVSRQGVSSQDQTFLQHGQIQQIQVQKKLDSEEISDLGLTVTKHCILYIMA